METGNILQKWMEERMWCAFKIWWTILLMMHGTRKEKETNKDTERIIVTAAKLITAEIREKE